MVKNLATFSSSTRNGAAYKKSVVVVHLDFIFHRASPAPVPWIGQKVDQKVSTTSTYHHTETVT